MKNSPKRPSLMLALAFVFVGALPWLAEGMVTPKYAEQSPSQVVQKVISVSNAPSEAELQGFASRPGAFSEIGRVLYPRFFPRGKGLASANPWPVYEVRDFPRFGFLLINQKLTMVVFPSNSSVAIPHAVEAVVLGCAQADHVEARLIAFPDLDAIYMSAPLSEPCPP